MKKIYFILSILFVILTFVGAAYVLCHRGEANAGYSVIPMIFAIVCIGFYRQKR